MARNERQQESAPRVEVLLERCGRLNEDLASFDTFLTTKKFKAVDIRHFRGSVQSEYKSLQRLTTANPEASKTIHNLRSSNLPFYEAVWATAKASTCLIGLQKRFYWQQPARKDSSKNPKKKSALVDVVSADGLLWTKVSTISQNKLLFDKAKAGWEADEWASSDDEGVSRKVFAEGAEPANISDGEDSDEDDGRTELVRVAQDLKRASQATWVSFKHPDVLFVLPNLKEGDSKEIDSILDEIKALGITIRCGRLPSQHDTGFLPMLPLFKPQMTSIINLDCTILLALISDLSHTDPREIVLPEKAHPSLMHQLEIERCTPLLPQIVYPGLVGAQHFVTSKRSAVRMWEIVNTIGTVTEKTRADLFFAPVTDDNRNREIREELARLSVYPLPDLPLPIEVLDNGIRADSGIPDRVLDTLSAELSDINRSVFLLGWTSGWTTVTSNKVAVRAIEGIIVKELEKSQDQEGGASFQGPSLWTIDVARSLVGKEGGRAW